MRRPGIVVWMLLMLLVAIPALRHAAVAEFAGSSQVGVQHAPRSAPAIARTATIPAVAVELPAPVAMAVAPCPVPPASPAPPDAAPLVPLRL